MSKQYPVRCETAYGPGTIVAVWPLACGAERELLGRMVTVRLDEAVTIDDCKHEYIDHLQKVR